MVKNECSQLYSSLILLCTDNAAYFTKNNAANEQHKKLRSIFADLKSLIEVFEPLVDRISRICLQYDFDVNLKANGYRSFVTIANLAVQRALDVSQKITASRSSFLFRRHFYAQELQSCHDLIENLKYCFESLWEIYNASQDDDIFTDNHPLLVKVLDQLETINLPAFYGRCLGFQFYESLKNVFKFILILMSAFSEVYYNQGSIFSKTIGSMWKSGKYLFNPEFRAERVVNVCKHVDIHFCKSFWCLAENELMHILPSLVIPSLAVNRILSVPPEKLTFVNDDQADIDIPIPSSHIGLKPIQIRLISSRWRKGMVGLGERNINDQLDPSPHLLIHCHGGGFVAQSSKAHLSYLRDWAKILNVPILSIDYNLAPYAPYPRALEEVFYAYAWALKNAKLLGSTGEAVVLAGDSAGANLIVGLSMKCQQFRIRQPDALFLAYAPIFVNLVMSPARMMSIMDPILPFGFLIKCVKAYATQTSDETDAKLQVIDDNDDDDVEEAEDACVINIGNVMLNSDNDIGMDESFTNAEVSSLGSTINQESFEVMDLDVSEQNIPEIADQDCEGDDYLASIPNDSNTTKLLNMISVAVSKWLNHNKNSLPQNNCFNNKAVKYTDLIDYEIPKDYLLSPIYAPDEILMKLPPIHVLTSKFDPFLDDDLMFAKKLRKLGNQVNVDVLDGLPHGFLNLSMVSKEAHEGSLKCANIIASLFKFDVDD